MSSNMAEYNELYAVSDLHLGGEQTNGKNFQVFKQGRRLAGLIRHIAASRPKDDVALVLNGDIIDSLAEDGIDGYIALSSMVATAMMDRIFSDRSFAPVWEALTELVKTPHRHLIFVLGNHDLELALPEVQASILRRLTEGSSEAAARICFSTQGAGFSCHVGGARVFATHGNEVDAFNWVDYNALGQLANAMNAGRAADHSRWKPNAGTRLVVDVMNRFKKRYPFIDLLKPEKEAAVKILLALDEDAFKDLSLNSALRIRQDFTAGKVVVNDLLGEKTGTGNTVPEPDDPGLSLLAGEVEQAKYAQSDNQRALEEDALLIEAEKRMDTGLPASEIVSAGRRVETLGLTEDAVRALIGIDTVEKLRKKLRETWVKDTSFDTGKPDDIDRRVMARVGADIDFVIAGHTHLCRAIRMQSGRYYYNCGTWMRLIRLTDNALEKNAFKRVYKVLKSGRMSSLDEENIPGPNDTRVPLVFDRTNVVRLSADGKGVTGELLRVTDGVVRGEVTLTPEDGIHTFLDN